MQEPTKIKLTCCNAITTSRGNSLKFFYAIFVPCVFSIPWKLLHNIRSIIYMYYICRYLFDEPQFTRLRIAEISNKRTFCDFLQLYYVNEI